MLSLITVKDFSLVIFSRILFVISRQFFFLTRKGFPLTFDDERYLWIVEAF